LHKTRALQIRPEKCAFGPDCEPLVTHPGGIKLNKHDLAAYLTVTEYRNLPETGPHQLTLRVQLRAQLAAVTAAVDRRVPANSALSIDAQKGEFHFAAQHRPAAHGRCLGPEGA
jgi:hypothetical protein